MSQQIDSVMLSNKSMQISSTSGAAAAHTTDMDHNMSNVGEPGAQMMS